MTQPENLERSLPGPSNEYCCTLFDMYNVFNTMTVDQRGPDPCHTKMLNNIYQSSMDMVTWSI